MSDQSKLPEPATKEAASARTLIIFALMWFGVSFNASLSSYMLPKTIEAIDNDPRTIGLLLALNPLFGLIAQPLVGLLSDHIWTPIGRRAFFIIVSAPLVAVCLLFIPYATLLWQIFVLVLFFELFHDVIVGSDHPLIADLVPPEGRMVANGIIMVAVQLGSIVLLYIGMGIVVENYGDQRLFQMGAGVQILCVMLPAFFLQEKPVEKLPRPKLTLRRYISDLWSSTPLRRLAMTNFWIASFDNLIKTFVVLYATNVLGGTKSDFGERWFLHNLVALALALPLGILIERKIPKQFAIIVGIAFEMAACIVALFAKDINDIYLIALLFGIGFAIKSTTFKPFFTEFIPRDLIGQVSGAINIFYAVGRLIVTYGGGWVVYFFSGDYRVLFYFALAAGACGIWTVSRVKDERYLNKSQR
ncbi:MAG: MFS transporter [Verrucomicrobiota bacterium]